MQQIVFNLQIAEWELMSILSLYAVLYFCGKWVELSDVINYNVV
jgi:hypothetical protein